MNFDAFIEKLFAKAAQAGMEDYEVYYSAGESFQVSVFGGVVDSYKVSSRAGLSFRGAVDGSMGMSYTEVLDEEAADMLVSRAMENARVLAGQDPQLLYDGKNARYARLALFSQALEEVTPEAKIAAALAMEKAALAMDGVRSVAHCAVSTGRGEVRIVNSRGLDLHESENSFAAFMEAIVEKDGTSVDGFAYVMGRDFTALDPAALAAEAVENARAKLGASSVPSGETAILLDRETVADLMATFAGMFSAEAAQKGLSRLAGREGEVIAAPCVTLTDDPLMPDGASSGTFDAQGVPARTKAVIENGKLMTLLHNLETAAKAGAETTGNAARPGYKGKVSVAPTNLCLLPGEKTPEAIMQDMGSGLLITEVSGLHAGANGVTGDFSLTARGFVIEDGKKGRPVDQITVAGNFYDLLRDVVEVGSDMRMTMSGVGTPSVRIRSLMVAGE